MKTMDWREPKDGDLIAVGKASIFNKRDWVKSLNMPYGAVLYFSFMFLGIIMEILGHEFLNRFGFILIFVPKIIDLLAACWFVLAISIDGSYYKKIFFKDGVLMWRLEEGDGSESWVPIERDEIISEEDATLKFRILSGELRIVSTYYSFYLTRPYQGENAKKLGDFLNKKKEETKS